MKIYNDLAEGVPVRRPEMLPAAASVDGSVDTTAAVSPRVFAEALRIIATEEGVAALIAVLSNWTCTAPMRYAARWAASEPVSPGGCPPCWSSL